MSRRLHAALFVATLLFTFPLHANICEPKNTVHADVVALDEAFYNNRLGTFQSGGMIFALRRDVQSNKAGVYDLKPGEVMLRPNKRPRPMVLRMNVGDCLEISFQNLLADTQQVYFKSPPVPWNGTSQMTTANPGSSTNPINSYGAGFIQPPTRWAGVHVMGLQPVAAWDENGMPIEGISADGSWAGANDITANIATAMRASGLVRPGGRIKVQLYAPEQSEGSYLLYSTAATNGVAPTYGGQLMQGLFGSVTVQPKQAEYYRSQVTRDELWAATFKSAGKTLKPTGQTVTINGKPAPVKRWRRLGVDYAYHMKAGEVPYCKPVIPKPEDVDVVILDQNGDPAASGGLYSKDAQPLLDYQAVDGAGTPILRMTKGTAPREIVHSDLTAIITGANAGPVTCSPFYDVPSTPNAHQPWREFAIHYHDDFAATQAFPQMITGNLASVFVAGQDLFAINYGMGGIGAEILANRIGLGPQYQCATCMYEEFFLSSWAVGDPAMVVDLPANTNSNVPGPKATKALYPDDPSNVYHSYVGDHVIFQILHAGTNITHVHHMHAQQWLHSPRNANGAYRDSQMISPGASYTLNHVYNGSGNVNKTIGDSIFHCHFYPHFAQGMWAMWRVHDMFEEGTRMNSDGTVSTTGWNRALPDGEIPSGTPTPALVPLPTIAMPLIPARTRLVPVEVAANGTKPVGYTVEVEQDPKCKKPGDKACKNPGYPFFVPGVAGQRAPHPPLDFAWEEEPNGKPKMDHGKMVLLDGGLPRHLALWDTAITHVESRWDFTKTNHKLTTVEVPEEGTFTEQVAMKFNGHRNAGQPFWPSFTPSGTPRGFEVNGLPSRHGAPYANPNRRLDGSQQCTEEPEDQVAKVLDPEVGPQPCLIRYKAADIQIDAVFNKAGWHFPQTRLLALWGDVKATEETKRMPEPFFFRANSEQIIEYWHSNLVPEYYELDDFQVRTPTDVIGQHIHLVKFDVTSSDGAGNGYNYEDGTLGPGVVREWIKASNQCPSGDISCTNCVAGIFDELSISAGVARPGTTRRCLKPKTIPYFGDGPDGQYIGAQATIQRWSADPVFGQVNFGKTEPHKYGADPERHIDRTLRTVFTHDHFGPSTHQQAGLYAGLLVEPNRSVWRDGQKAGVHYGSNDNRPLGANGQPPRDGGPTGWQANIIDRDKESNSYREFALEFADTQLAYTADSRRYASPYDEGKNKNYTGWADPAHAIGAPGNPLAGSPSCTTPSGPTPELISNLVPTGTYSVNYRNEPLTLRLFGGAPAGPTNTTATDPSFAFASVHRNTAKLNTQPPLGTPISPFNGFKYPGPFTGAQPLDPYTPLLRTYDGDQVQVRTLVGAHLSPHFFNVHGVNWLFEPQEDDSGYRSAQGMGISEHYEMIFQMPRGSGATSDYLYETTSDTLGRKNGNWGILRSYRDDQRDLVRLPNNRKPATEPPNGCPSDAPRRTYHVRATRIQDVTAKSAQFPNGMPLFYNTRGQAGQSGGQKLADPYAIIYVDEDDLDSNGLLKNQQRVEPLILRAAAGECVVVTLRNMLPATSVSSSLLNPNFTAGFPVTGTETQVNNWITTLSGNNGCTKAFYTTEFQQAFNAQNGLGYTLPDSTQTTKLQWNCVKPADAACTVPADCPPAGVPMAPASECTTTIALGTTPTQTFYVGRDPYDKTRVWVQATEQVSTATSTAAGLHASLLQYDIRKSDGMNVGQNPVQSIAPGGTTTYEWYAGRYQQNPITHAWHHFPIEFGSVNLNPSDPLLQHPKGLIGALIVEPIKATWKTDANSKASARVHYTVDGQKRTFREFVAMIQDDVSLELSGPANQVPMTFTTNDPRGLLGNWSRAFNYKVEPMGYRYISPNFLQNTASNAPSGVVRAQSDQLTLSDPQTPVFAAAAGDAVRIRMLHPAGLNEQVLTLHGHSWEEEPYIVGKTGVYAPAGPTGVASAIIGHNPKSQRNGSRDSFGPNISWDLVIGEYDKNGKVVDGAGGIAKTYGDYMFRTFIGSDFFDGLWGLLRIGGYGKDIVTVTYYTNGSDSRFPAGIKGTVTANTSNGEVASKVEIYRGTSATAGGLVELVNVDRNTGEWASTANVAPPLFVRSACTAGCTPIGPWGSMSLPTYIPTTGDPKQEAAATSAAPANLNIKGTAPTDQFRKEANPPQPPEQPQPQPQPPQP